MPSVTSKDGTGIATTSVGQGPPLLLVDGAFCRIDFGPAAPLARLLQDSVTVT